MKLPNSSRSLAQKLLTGKLTLDLFKNIEISEITSDSRLCSVYHNADVENLEQFLKLGESRFQLRNYGRKSENKLKKAIVHFLEEKFLESVELDLEIPVSDQRLLDIVNSTSPYKSLDELEWKTWTSLLVENKLLDDTIYHLCMETDCNWPFKGNWKDKLIGDYVSSSLEDLLNTKNFGKIKLNSLIKAVAYQLSGKRQRILKLPIEEQLVWLRENIPVDDNLQEILKSRLKGETLEEIGRRQSVTRERIRQLERDTLFKYRSSFGLRVCSAYLEHFQDEIWNRVSKGKLVIPCDHSLNVESVNLDENDIFALYVYYGEKVKGERFSDILKEFLNARFKSAGNSWYNLSYDELDVQTAILLLEAKLQQFSSPIAMSLLFKKVDCLSDEILSLGLELSENLWSYRGYVTSSKLTIRTRRTIDCHILLSTLSKNKSIVSLSDLWEMYRSSISYDNCYPRDLEIIMSRNQHLFFKVGQEGWSAIGSTTSTSTSPYYSGSDIEIEEQESDDISPRLQAISEALKTIGISHSNELHEHLLEKGFTIPENSIQPTMFMSDLFYKFAPGFYGLREWIGDNDRIAQGRTKLLDDDVLPKQLKSYVFSRYAGEPSDVFPLWGFKMEMLWAKALYERQDNELTESFWHIIEPKKWLIGEKELRYWQDRSSDCQYRLNSSIPNIASKDRVDFKQIFTALLFLKHEGRISGARVNLLMGLPIDRTTSIPLLSTLVLTGALKVADDWRKSHYPDVGLDPLLEMLKTELSYNKDLNWDNGLDQLLMPLINANLKKRQGGWMANIDKRIFAEHFKPKAQKSKQSSQYETPSLFDTEEIQI